MSLQYVSFWKQNAKDSSRRPIVSPRWNVYPFLLQHRSESINPEKHSRNSSAAAARVMYNRMFVATFRRGQFRNGGACKLRKLLFGSRSGPHNERPSRSATVTNRKLSRSVSFLSFAPRARRKPCKLSFRTELTVAFFNPLRSSHRPPFPSLFFLTPFTPETARAQRAVARVKLYLRASGSLKVHFIKDLRDYSEEAEVRRMERERTVQERRRGEWKRRESLPCGSATALLTYTFVAELKARGVPACIRLELY